MAAISPNETSVKTVFFLQSAHCQSNRALLAGVIRAGKDFGWVVRTIEYASAAADRRQHATTNRDFRTEFKMMRDFWTPIGIIADCGAAPKVFSKIRFSPLPAVFLDCQPSNVGKGSVCVYSDDKDIGTLAARELLALNYAAYAYAPFTDNLPWSLNRERAYRQALALCHKTCHTFRKNRPSVNDITYLSELDWWIRELPKPAAVFAANDYIGELVLTAAGKCGFKVPEDIAVIGVDNDEEICLRTNPTLSSIKPDHEKAGYLAAALLKQVISARKRQHASATFGALAVFHRNSTLVRRRHDDRVMKAVETIRRHAHLGLTIPQLVAEVGVSRRLLELRFRETLGHSILSEIRAIQIERAKVMLTHTRESMDEVARSTGFPSTQSFRNAFGKAMGMPPVSWRKHHLR